MTRKRKSTPLLPVDLIEKYFLLQPVELQTDKLKHRFIIEQQNYIKQFQIIELLKSILPKSSEPIKLLDIGAGIGSFLYRCRIKGLKPFGVEPSYSQSSLAYEFFSNDDFHLVNAIGEQLPFADKVFDCVVSISVLEHCKIIEKFINEAIRVLRPGGVFYLVFPNYDFFWEPHYDVFWIPRLPKAILASYLGLRHRDPRYLNEIHFLKPRKIRKVIEKQNLRIVDISAKHFLERLADPNKIGVPAIARALKRANRVGITEKLKWLPQIGFYYPVIWLVFKEY